jgi:divalent metal cation (Fe/Co/Zn/Cd) transporter
VAADEPCVGSYVRGDATSSVVLAGDGKHLLTDVWTTGGVLVGIALVALFDLEILDPIVALLVGVNILWMGYRLLRRSVVGLLDATLPREAVQRVHAVTDHYRETEPVDFETIRTRESVSTVRLPHVLVPGD